MKTFQLGHFVRWLLLSNAVVAFSPIPAQISTWGAANTTKKKSSSSSPSLLRATEKLIFKGDYKKVTDVFPEGTTKKDISRFLSKRENRNIFLSAGGTRRLEELDMTPQFKEYWQDVCAHFSSDSLPNDDDKLIAVNTEVKFPGVKLTLVSVSGVKEIYDGNRVNGYEFLSVAEKTEASGAPPVVWIFNKLTGYDQREKGVFYPSKQSQARSILSAISVGDRMALCFDLNLQVTVEFPAVLMKILPSSKEKMEEQGTKSVLKSVSKDIERSCEAAYNKFVKEHTSSVEKKR